MTSFIEFINFTPEPNDESSIGESISTLTNLTKSIPGESTVRSRFVQMKSGRIIVEIMLMTGQSCMNFLERGANVEDAISRAASKCRTELLKSS